MTKQFHALKARISGLTLIEILVALGVLGVVLAVAVPSMADLLEKRRVIAAAGEVSGLLTYAKAETNATDSLLIVRFDPDVSSPPQVSCALVATSAGLNKCRCYLPASNVCPGTSQKPLRLFQLPRTHVKFEASSTNWGGTPNYIRFMREQMTMAAENFQVEVVGLKKGYTLRVKVNSAGQVKTCSPNGDMSGYGPC
jgi:type IV fimbrial biogenesis protein FimT